jgi:putative PIN family toxin of toxin-antitoxin system
MKVTLDTNVLISGTFWTGDSFKILNLIDKGEIKCVLSEEILKEYKRIIKSEEITEKIKEKDLLLKKVVQKVIINSKIVKPQIKLDVVKEDKDDNKIIECAIKGKVDYIISKDKHLLKLKKYKRIFIIKPEDFLKKLLE